MIIITIILNNNSDGDRGQGSDCLPCSGRIRTAMQALLVAVAAPVAVTVPPPRSSLRISLPAPPAPAPGLCCHSAPSPALQHLRRSPGSGTSPAEPVSVSPPLVPPQPRRSLPATLPRKLGRGRCRERTSPAGGSTGTSLPGTAGEENGDAMG